MRKGMSQSAWILLGVAILAFASMASTVAIQVVPPPVPESISTSTALYLGVSTIIFVLSFIAFVWTLLSKDTSDVA